MTVSKTKEASQLLVIISFATVYLVWGSTYFFILIALQGFPPMIMGALRFLIAGSLMLAWSFFRGEKLFIKNNIKHSAISGFLTLSVGTGAVIWVEQYLPSALVAILISAAPIWFVLMDKQQWKENFTNKSTVTGLVIGLVGVVFLFSEKINSLFSASGNQVELGAMLLLLASNFSWTAGSIYSKYKATSGSNTVNVGWQMFAAGVPFVLAAYLREEPQNMEWQTIPAKAWLSLFYLIFFGSIAAFTAYVWLLQVRPSAQVSTYAYVNPVVAVLLGVFFASEKISLLQILGLLIILASVLLINLARYRAARR